jgi:hypothetical protein
LAFLALLLFATPVPAQEQYMQLGQRYFAGGRVTFDGTVGSYAQIAGGMGAVLPALTGQGATSMAASA